jgi:hypothetical protein
MKDAGPQLSRRDLALAVGGSGARPADRDASSIERHLAILWP